MPVKARPVIDRILPRCIETPEGCWQFTGALSDGYGYVGAGPRGSGNIHTHRATYTFFVNEVPAGLDLDHLCRNRACCNPWHLEPVTRKVNAGRGLRGPGYGLRDITHCKRGHERRCRTCIRSYYYAKKAAA